MSDVLRRKVIRLAASLPTNSGLRKELVAALTAEAASGLPWHPMEIGKWYKIRPGRGGSNHLGMWFHPQSQQKNGSMRGLMVIWPDDRRVPDKAKITQVDARWANESWVEIDPSHIEPKAMGRFRSRMASEDREAAAHGLNVGDILYSSWGYDQTNIDFYEVTAVRGSMVEIREVKAKVIRTNVPYTYLVPVPGRYIGPPMRKRPSANGSIKIASYAYAYPWDGKPKMQTMSEYGH